MIKPHTAFPALACLAAGALTTLAFAPFGAWWLAPLTLAVLFVLTTGIPARRAAFFGGLFGLGFFALGVNWVSISIHIYGHSPLAMAWGAAAALIVYLAAFPALMMYLANRLAGQASLTRFLLVLPGLWLLSEWLRSWLFTGFPWLSLGYSQIDSPLSGYAPLLGYFGAAGALLLSAGVLAAVTLRPRRYWPALLVAGLLWLIGSGLQGREWTTPAGEALTVSLIQGNIPQEQKWLPEEQLATMEHYLSMTRQEWYGDPDWKPDLVVWPETAIPAFYYQVEDGFIAQLQRETAAAGSSLLTGIPVLDRGDWQYYNAVVSIGPAPRFYYKRHLVPFGEYLPLRRWLDDLLAVMPLPVADFSSGSDEQPLLTAAGYAAGTTICYEIIFPEDVRSTLPQAAFLVNVSNDGWFGDSWAPHQHLEMARMRALEAGRYLLRATNTGISAVITPQGRVSTVAPQFAAAVVRDRIVPLQSATPYVRWGDWPMLGLALLAVLIGLVRRKKP